MEYFVNCNTAPLVAVYHALDRNQGRPSVSQIGFQRLGRGPSTKRSAKMRVRLVDTLMAIRPGPRHPSPPRYGPIGTTATTPQTKTCATNCGREQRAEFRSAVCPRPVEQQPLRPNELLLEQPFRYGTRCLRMQPFFTITSTACSAMPWAISRPLSVKWDSPMQCCIIWMAFSTTGTTPTRTMPANSMSFSHLGKETDTPSRISSKPPAP